MISRALLEDAFDAAVAAQHAALPGELAEALNASGYSRRTRFGLAIGKAALTMARALGPVVDGLAVAPYDDGEPLPRGWRRMVSSHPFIDERSLVAGDAVLEFVAGVPLDAIIVALISGGGSALVEVPRVPLDAIRQVVAWVMRAGEPIGAINAVRIALSAIKGGGLLAHTSVPVVTLAISDVVDDSLATIASGPTILRDHARNRFMASDVLARCKIDLELPPPLEVPLRTDYARVVVPMRSFARRIRAALASRGVELPLLAHPMDRDVGDTTRDLTPSVRWGEPVMHVPEDYGEGGRMQQLALESCARLRDTTLCVFAVGSDGIDGPPPEGRPAPAGAYVDGSSRDAMELAGIDVRAAIARCNAGEALNAIGALVITGPTGINSADVVVVG